MIVPASMVTGMAAARRLNMSYAALVEQVRSDRWPGARIFRLAYEVPTMPYPQDRLIMVEAAQVAVRMEKQRKEGK